MCFRKGPADQSQDGLHFTNPVLDCGAVGPDARGSLISFQRRFVVLRLERCLSLGKDRPVAAESTVGSLLQLQRPTILRLLVKDLLSQSGCPFVISSIEGLLCFRKGPADQSQDGLHLTNPALNCGAVGPNALGSLISFQRRFVVLRLERLLSHGKDRPVAFELLPDLLNPVFVTVKVRPL